jgi:restriction system protein
MARKRTSWVVQQQRAALQQQRRVEQARRVADRAVRELEATRLRADRAKVAAYFDSRNREALRQTREVEQRVAALQSLLKFVVGKSTAIDFERLKESFPEPPFEPGPLAIAQPAPNPSAFEPPKPGGLMGVLPGAKQKHLEAVQAGRAAWEAARTTWEATEANRRGGLEEAQKAHARLTADLRSKVEAQNTEVEALAAAFAAGDPQAVVQYFSLVLAQSKYPDEFPTERRVAFVPESRQLVVEIELPTVASAVPAERAFKYVKARDEIESTPRPARERKELYEQVVVQTTLRTLYELVRGDTSKVFDTLILNGIVRTVAPATGQPITPCLVSVRISKDTFVGIDLRNIDPIACLKGLNAGVSRSPDELAPVRPVLEFDMVDPRFVEEADVLSELDQRPNLMELTPTEFESVITNLFTKMGLETAQTRPSRDGGVDCVAWDNRPIFGGKVVIQAKRYKNTVGVSAVRDLFGTLQNEGASKGILVTTSGYGKASFEFASGKPLELLDGANLLYLLEQHACVKAKIVVPETWVDVFGDVPIADEPPIDAPRRSFLPPS